MHAQGSGGTVVWYFVQGRQDWKGVAIDKTKACKAQWSQNFTAGSKDTVIGNTSGVEGGSSAFKFRTESRLSHLLRDKWLHVCLLLST